MQETEITIDEIEHGILGLKEREAKPVIEFVGRYSKDWYFIVPISFKDPFGIKKGTGKNKDKIYQSHATILEQGDTFYNNVLAYDNWLEFLKTDNAQCIEIHFSNVNNFDENTKEFKEGIVRFHLYAPSNDKAKIELKGKYYCSAFTFLHILKHGHKF